MDRRQFAEEFQLIHRRLWLIAASVVGNRTDAEDIVQEAAVIAFRKLDSFETGTSFGAWVARIVKYCAANYSRKTRGRRTQVTDPASLDARAVASTGPRPFDGLGDLSEFQSQYDDETMRLLMQLTEDARACLLLRVVDDLTYAEISELLGIPEGTAMSHVHRSKQQLRRGLVADDAGKKGVSNE